jgi:hypothetical protein
MLVVSGGDANPYLQKLFQGDSLVDYHQQSVSQVDYAHLTDHRFIILDELPSISSGMAHTLLEFVTNGGSLLVVPGKDAVVTSYNQMLASMLMPQIGAWEDRQVRAEQVQQDADLYQGVFQGVREDLELPTVTGYYRLVSSSSTVGQSLIRLLDGSDFLIVTPVGQGRCYLVSTPLRKEHTDFVQQAMFVPTLYNMALFSTPPLRPYHQLTATDPIPLTGSYDAEQTKADVEVKITGGFDEVNLKADKYTTKQHGDNEGDAAKTNSNADLVYYANIHS